MWWQNSSFILIFLLFALKRGCKSEQMHLSGGCRSCLWIVAKKCAVPILGHQGVITISPTCGKLYSSFKVLEYVNGHLQICDTCWIKSQTRSMGAIFLAFLDAICCCCFCLTLWVIRYFFLTHPPSTPLKTHSLSTTHSLVSFSKPPLSPIEEQSVVWLRDWFLARCHSSSYCSEWTQPQAAV